MVKPKQRQLTAKASKKKRVQTSHSDSSNSDNESDLHGEDSWVVIKKQLVTILVPALPVAKAKSSITPKPELSQLQTMLAAEVVDNESELIVQTCPEMPSVDEQGKSTTLLAPKNSFQSAKSLPTQQIPAQENPPKLESEMVLGNQNLVGTSKSEKINTASKISDKFKGPQHMYGPGSVDVNTVMKHKLRALILERKIAKAGGLSRWLASLGLGQFVNMFRSKRISKFQLVTLNMKRLKDMGVIAVGPRRKLIHAIDCVCRPYCF